LKAQTQSSHQRKITVQLFTERMLVHGLLLVDNRMLVISTNWDVSYPSFLSNHGGHVNCIIRVN